MRKEAISIVAHKGRVFAFLVSGFREPPKRCVGLQTPSVGPRPIAAIDSPSMTFHTSDGDHAQPQLKPRLPSQTRCQIATENRSDSRGRRGHPDDRSGPPHRLADAPPRHLHLRYLDLRSLPRTRPPSTLFPPRLGPCQPDRPGASAARKPLLIRERQARLWRGCPLRPTACFTSAPFAPTVAFRVAYSADGRPSVSPRRSDRCRGAIGRRAEAAAAARLLDVSGDLLDDHRHRHDRPDESLSPR